MRLLLKQHKLCHTYFILTVSQWHVYFTSPHTISSTMTLVVVCRLPWSQSGTCGCQLFSPMALVVVSSLPLSILALVVICSLLLSHSGPSICVQLLYLWLFPVSSLSHCCTFNNIKPHSGSIFSTYGYTDPSTGFSGGCHLC